MKRSFVAALGPLLLVPILLTAGCGSNSTPEPVWLFSTDAEAGPVNAADLDSALADLLLLLAETAPDQQPAQQKRAIPYT